VQNNLIVRSPRDVH